MKKKNMGAAFMAAGCAICLVLAGCQSASTDDPTVTIDGTAIALDARLQDVEELGYQAVGGNAEELESETLQPLYVDDRQFWLAEDDEMTGVSVRICNKDTAEMKSTEDCTVYWIEYAPYFWVDADSEQFSETSGYVPDNKVLINGVDYRKKTADDIKKKMKKWELTSESTTEDGLTELSYEGEEYEYHFFCNEDGSFDHVQVMLAVEIQDIY